MENLKKLSLVKKTISKLPSENNNDFIDQKSVIIACGTTDHTVVSIFC